MTTIHKTIEIPPDRHLSLDLSLPDDIPAGKAKMEITISPAEKTMSSTTLRALAGSWANSKAFNRDGLTIQREMRDEWE